MSNGGIESSTSNILFLVDGFPTSFNEFSLINVLLRNNTRFGRRLRCCRCTSISCIFSIGSHSWSRGRSRWGRVNIGVGHSIQAFDGHFPKLRDGTFEEAWSATSCHFRGFLGDLNVDTVPIGSSRFGVYLVCAVGTSFS